MFSFICFVYCFGLQCVWELGFESYLLSAFLAIMHHDWTESPFYHRYYKYKKEKLITEEKQTRIQPLVEVWSTLLIFPASSINNSLIIRKINKEMKISLSSGVEFMSDAEDCKKTNMTRPSSNKQYLRYAKVFSVFSQTCYSLSGDSCFHCLKPMYEAIPLICQC